MSGDILVTGGAGFIGGAVARELRAAGHAVRAGVRRHSPASPVGTVACDLDRMAEIRAAVEGVGIVIHCAYGDEGAMAEQCGRLLEAMSDAGVDAMIYFSSIAVYGDADGTGVEDPPRAGLQGTYATGKLECERRVRAWRGAGPGRRAIILRPGVVYGAGSRFWIDKMVERIRAGVWGDFGPAADGPAPLVHVDDVASAVTAAVAALRADPEAGRAAPPLDLVGPETPAWNDYFKALAARLSAPPLPRIGPATLAWRRLRATAAKIWRRAGLPGGRHAALAPTGGELQLFARKAVYDVSHAREALGFRASVGLEEGLARSIPAQDTSPDP